MYEEELEIDEEEEEDSEIDEDEEEWWIYEGILEEEMEE